MSSLTSAHALGPYDCKGHGTQRPAAAIQELVGSAAFPTKTPGGVYAKTLNYSPWVQPGSTVFAWSMLQQAGNAYLYGQIGWIEFGGGQRFTFVEANNSGTPTGTWWRMTMAPDPIGSSSYYTTLFNPYNPSDPTSRGNLTWQDNGVDPTGGWYYGTGWSPTEALVAGEIHNQADQMPGGVNQNETFTDTQIYKPAGPSGTWSAMAGTAFNEGPLPVLFGDTTPDSKTTRIWDTQCK
jgi:hypothetical protein